MGEGGGGAGCEVKTHKDKAITHLPVKYSIFLFFPLI